MVFWVLLIYLLSLLKVVWLIYLYMFILLFYLLNFSVISVLYIFNRLIYKDLFLKMQKLLKFYLSIFNVHINRYIYIEHMPISKYFLLYIFN